MEHPWAKGLWRTFRAPPPRTSLIAARRGKTLLAPFLFQGTAHAQWVNAWTRAMLCKELRPGSTLIWDNASFHRKKDLEAIAAEQGHFILFLPPYSPDLNPIENDFANLKKRRQFAPQYPSVTYPQVFVNLDYR